MLAASHVPPHELLPRHDRRRTSRVKTLVRACLYVGDGEPVDGVLVERSRYGASLLLDMDQPFPTEALTLFTYHDGQSSAVRLRWRRGRRLGVQLLGAI